MQINKKSRIISIILQWTITVMYPQKYIHDKQGQWQEYCHVIPWIVSCLKIQKIMLGPKINPLFWCLFTRNQRMQHFSYKVRCPWEPGILFTVLTKGNIRPLKICNISPKKVSFNFNQFNINFMNFTTRGLRLL